MLYYKIHEILLKLLPLTLCILNTGTKMLEKVAALNIVHCILSKYFIILIIFFKSTIFKYLSTICLNMQNFLVMRYESQILSIYSIKCTSNAVLQSLL